jgi:hypothetical protein
MRLRWLDSGNFMLQTSTPRPVRWSKVIPILVRLALAQLYREPLLFPVHADKRARKAHR